ncbi:MAG: glycoside hydrolase family 2 TIM barrel-domain containing protein [bacterium]
MYKEMDLCGSWDILPVKRFDGNYDFASGCLKATVPGHWQQTAGLENHTGKTVYKKRFQFRPEPGKRLFIRFGGVFYWYTVYLNGVRLGANEGYFFPVDYEVTGLMAEDNELLVEADCPAEENKTEKRQITGVFHHWVSMDPDANPGGIWLPVEILSTGPVRITEPFFSTVYIKSDGSRARLFGEITINSDKESDLEIHISFVPRTFDGETQIFTRQVYVSAGERTYQYQLDLYNPVLWWTHDHGRPELYTLEVKATVKGESDPSDTFHAPFGVRTVEMRNYVTYLNGRRLYVRGNNYPPGDVRIADMTKERAEQDVDLVMKCNLNMLRVHGHVGHPAFYEVCDEKGMLVWQDFPLQWGYSKEVQPQALRQTGKMVKHLGNHPSIALWCMHNEPFRMYDPAKRPGPLDLVMLLFTRYIRSRDREVMDPELAARTRFLDPHRPAIESSGERGVFRKPGDTHLYYGWHMGPLSRLHKKYRKRPELFRFVSEFGAQSFPEPESARRFMEADLARLDFKKLQIKHQCRPLVMKAYLNPKKYKTLEELIRASQGYQSRLNRYYIDRARALKYKPCGGCLAYIFVDANPAVQWSVLDYWRVPKNSYYELKKAMSPVYAFTVLEKKKFRRNQVVSIPVYAVNDRWKEAGIHVKLSVVSPAGDVVLEKDHAETLEADSMALALMNAEVRLRWQGIYRLVIHLQAEDVTLENEYELEVK